MKLSVLLITLVLMFQGFSAKSFQAQATVPSPEINSHIVIAEVQTSGVTKGTSAEEFISLFNPTSQDIDITGWCIKYSPAGNGLTFSTLTCVIPQDNYTEIWLPEGGYISFATEEFATANTDYISDYSFKPKLASTGGHVILVDSKDSKTNKEIDRVGWGTAVIPEIKAFDIEGEDGIIKLFGRDLINNIIDTNDNSVDFGAKIMQELMPSDIYEKQIAVDVCPNIEGLQEILPSGYFFSSDGASCLTALLEDSVLLITELLPNAPSYDAGKEFIEIYNPNKEVVDLKGYILQLGLSYSKTYVIPSGSIKPGQYMTFSDTVTGLILPNTPASSVRIISPAGNLVSETAVYSNAKDDVSWALVNDLWIFTNQITPGMANKPYLIPIVNEVLGVTSVLAPCGVGKYRSPETNRCRNIKKTTSGLVPCNSNQYRNPDTNRCNNLQRTSSQLVSCKKGQSRNPATNRCRKNTSSSVSGLVPCKKGQKRNSDTNRCRKVAVLGASIGELSQITDVKVKSTTGSINWSIIFIAVGSTLAYMLYEWRIELSQQFSRFTKI